MMDLNYLCKMAYENACKRAEHESTIKLGAINTLKHCAGEVVEATESCLYYYDNETSDYKAIFAGELADIVCCVLTICGQENIDIELALTKCMEKNFRRGKQDETC